MYLIELDRAFRGRAAELRSWMAVFLSPVPWQSGTKHYQGVAFLEYGADRTSLHMADRKPGPWLIILAHDVRQDNAV